MSSRALLAIFLLFVLISPAAAVALESQDIGKVVISVVIPEDTEAGGLGVLTAVQEKIVQILTANGISSNQSPIDGSGFFVSPKISIVDSNVVEGGMQNINVVTVKIDLFIQQLRTNIIFSSFSNTFKGSGFDKASATINAVSKISVSDQKLAEFISSGRKKILEYYEMKIPSILSEVDSLRKSGSCVPAIGLLMAVPDGIKSYEEVRAKAVQVYLEYNEQICNEQLQKARGAIATGEYSKAAEYLSAVDPQTKCFDESKKLFKDVEKKFETQSDKQFQFMQKQQSDMASLGREQLAAIKGIALSYYKTNPKDIFSNS